MANSFDNARSMATGQGAHPITTPMNTVHESSVPLCNRSSQAHDRQIQQQARHAPYDSNHPSRIVRRGFPTSRNHSSQGHPPQIASIQDRNSSIQAGVTSQARNSGISTLPIDQSSVNEINAEKVRHASDVDSTAMAQAKKLVRQSLRFHNLCQNYDNELERTACLVEQMAGVMEKRHDNGVSGKQVKSRLVAGGWIAPISNGGTKGCNDGIFTIDFPDDLLPLFPIREDILFISCPGILVEYIE